MPIKNDGTGKRWVEMETVVPGTPEQVWQALATGAGNTAWFTKTTIDERVGGALRFEFGAQGGSAGEVTTWEPPHRFGYLEREWSPGAPPVATEITITSRSGDRCVVRMVHSLFSSTDDWDDQMEGFEKGWPAFFEVLRIYLAHFAGRPAASFVAMVQVSGEHLEVWKRLTAQLGIARVDAGDRCTTPQPEQLSGVVERIEQDAQQRFVLMRLDAPAPGVAIIGTYDARPLVNVSANVYFYGDNAAAHATASEQTWRAWLTESFARELTSAP
jgi:uncharacterized protein YndB with AHSA1/START domain